MLLDAEVLNYNTKRFNPSLKALRAKPTDALTFHQTQCDLSYLWIDEGPD